MNVVAIDLREHLRHIHATLAPSLGLDCDVAACDQRRVVEIGRQRLDQLGRVNVLLQGDLVVGLANLTTARQVNFTRADPPPLVRRCDGLAAFGILGVGIAAAWAWDARSLLFVVPAAVLYMPLLALGRFLTRGRLRMQVDSWLATVDVPAVGRAMLRRVK